MEFKTRGKGAFRLVGIAGLVIGITILSLSLISNFLVNNVESSHTYGITFGSSVTGTESSYFYYLIGMSVVLIVVSMLLFVRNGFLMSRRISSRESPARNARRSRSSRHHRNSR